MNYNKGQLGQMAKQYGFVRDTFEKVLRLKEILTYSVNVLFFMHPYRQIRSIRLLIRLRLMDWSFRRSGVICFRCFGKRIILI